MHTNYTVCDRWRFRLNNSSSIWKYSKHINNDCVEWVLALATIFTLYAHGPRVPAHEKNARRTPFVGDRRADRNGADFHANRSTTITACRRFDVRTQSGPGVTRRARKEFRWLPGRERIKTKRPNIERSCYCVLILFLHCGCPPPRRRSVVVFSPCLTAITTVCDKNVKMRTRVVEWILTTLGTYTL